MEKILIKNGSIIQNQTIERKDVLLTGTKISELGKISPPKKKLHTIDAEDLYVSPGFIDSHVNGGAGYNFLDNSEEAFSNILRFHAEHGTTGLLPTAVAFPIQKIRKFLVLVKKLMYRNPMVLGAHLNGPFISKEKSCAIPSRYILPLTLKNLNKVTSGFQDVIKIITLAPERRGAKMFIQELRRKGIIASLGHSNATYEETKKAMEWGLNHFTHFLNAMRELHHREPGAVGAGLESESTTMELIVDGIHVHPAAIKLLVRLRGISAICLVTDAIRAAGMGDGTYEFCGKRVFVKCGKAVLRDGTMAGSTLTMNQAVKNFKEFTGLGILEAVRVASLNPARLLGLDDRKGSIEKGKDADIVIFDKDFNVQYTIIGGKIFYPPCLRV
ncbi:N-acetylglucosamine-6-phosphate deacetylase [bacterium]|nr:N-acetylglucosamine-6-phosphate deacetylase [bacterium]NIO20062.1 N-acetylglucosamine-6-phosphate deacetylase [Candidatus Aenigmarchaeota archaeon]NIO74074.1 N-acetylglucosamine-6-phosphate deacetylase [bacterium]